MAGKLSGALTLKAAKHPISSSPEYLEWNILLHVWQLGGILNVRMQVLIASGRIILIALQSMLVN